MRLTTKAQALKPTDRRQEIKDDGGRGLYLFVQPSGAKTWKTIYSHHGRLRKVTLGRFPALGLSDAREAARQVFQQLDTGIDPIEARRQAEAEAEEARSQTFAAVARRYLADNQHLRSIREIENRLRPIIATWHDRPIAAIRRREIIALIDRIKAERGGAAACTWHTWIRRVLSWSLEKSLIEALPRLADSPYVFTATGKKPLTGVFRRTQELNALIDPPLSKWSPHDLRRTLRTGLSRLGVPAEIAERCLGHRARGIERHYNLHAYSAEKRAALQLWADHIDAVVTSPRTQVIQLASETVHACRSVS